MLLCCTRKSGLQTVPTVRVPHRSNQRRTEMPSVGFESRELAPSVRPKGATPDLIGEDELNENSSRASREGDPKDHHQTRSVSPGVGVSIQLLGTALWSMNSRICVTFCSMWSSC